jgi:hypothetical protein
MNYKAFFFAASDLTGFTKGLQTSYRGRAQRGSSLTSDQFHDPNFGLAGSPDAIMNSSLFDSLADQQVLQLTTNGRMTGQRRQFYESDEVK